MIHATVELSSEVFKKLITDYIYNEYGIQVSPDKVYVTAGPTRVWADVSESAEIVRKEKY